MKDGEIAVAQTPEINMMAPDLEETWCLSFWYLAYGRVSLFCFTVVPQGVLLNYVLYVRISTFLFTFFE